MPDLSDASDAKRLLKRQYFEIQELHTLVREIETLHVKVDIDSDSPFCDSCLEDWPCKHIQLIEAWRKQNV